jgi:hypothetical protein
MLDTRWWTRKANAHNTVAEAARAADTASSTQRTEDAHHLRLYSEREWAISQLADGASARTKAMSALKARKSRRLSLNVVRNNIDGWQNLICRGRPHINFLTKGADWSLQKTARMRTRFVEAHFLKRELYGKTPRVVKHAGIFGRGFVQVVKRHKMIDYEVVPPWELKIDPSEAYADDPRSLYRMRTIDRSVAKELFPEKAKELDAHTDDRLVLVDAWHLPSGPDANDGVYAQVIPGVVTLSWKRYKWEAFPIVPFFFDDAPLGWGGQGIAEELSGIQLEINAVLRTIQNNVYFGGNVKVAVERGSSASSTNQMSNALGGPVIEFVKTPPVFFTGNLGLAELLQHLQNLRREASEIIGISQMNVESQTPFASMSGRARIKHDQSYSQRFKTHQDRYEEFHKRLAERTLEAAADLAEAGENIEVIFPGRDHLEVIKYSDVAGKREDFDCEAWSASLVGETPSGRLAHIEQMMSLGMIDLEAAMQLYDVPYDLRSQMEATLAPLELAREAIDRIIENGEAVTPTPIMNLAKAAQLSGMWIQRGMLRGVDPAKLYLLLDFNKVCLMLLNRAQAPANANAGAPAVAPVLPGPGAPPVGPDMSSALAAGPVQLPAMGM